MATLVRSISQNGSVTCTAIDSTDIAAKAEQIHKTSGDGDGGVGPPVDRCVANGSNVEKGRELHHTSLAGRWPGRIFDCGY